MFNVLSISIYIPVKPNQIYHTVLLIFFYLLVHPFLQQIAKISKYKHWRLVQDVLYRPIIDINISFNNPPHTSNRPPVWLTDFWWHHGWSKLFVCINNCAILPRSFKIFHAQMIYSDADRSRSLCLLRENEAVRMSGLYSSISKSRNNSP